ncbi:hypothetical protein P3X46_021164 [Hevea brasiliensis]|uniref:50S ribosomal protein 6, chloroplastic n=1 Tax=Hevea brasiliensis TaxID=3981 RepID=A0ABQ9LGK5_HEVBR|nr:50S ribosomal protein 6, chloroplastic-like [Hevea brasiliensis]KAJ9166400.1 hypothetical protein P3X46_021164 [Hevea brasiliensis]
MNMTISSTVCSTILMLPKSTTLKPPNSQIQPPRIGCGYGGGGLLIECSSRPQKKATAHHMKTRPRKSQPWDIRRKPTVYPPLPPLPPDWTLVSSDDPNGDGGSTTEADLPSAPSLQAPVTSG